MAPTVPGGFEKVMIVTGGSRGDVQPYLALALELRKNGYNVCIATHVDFESFVSGEFGIKFYGVFCNVYEEILGNANIFKAICTGDTFKFVKGVSDYHKNHADDHLKCIANALDDFVPDLIVSGMFVEMVFNMALYQERIPAIKLDLTGMGILPESRATFGLPNLHCSFLNSWLHRQLIWGGQYDFVKTYDKAMQDVRGYSIVDVLSKRDFFQDLKHPPVPVLIAKNMLFFELLYGAKRAIPEGTKYIGGLVIAPEAQVLSSGKDGEEGAEHFWEASEMKGLRDFLRAGSPPVYMGWGSMICFSPEYMLTMVLKALYISGLRAVILGGWAKLSLGLLDRGRHPELYDYAQRSAIFVRAAPHEWLFPQCSLVVHHGGTGTLQAGFRAGVPTIVTPCLLDQFDSAAIVNSLGVGVGLRQFHKLTPEELGSALRTVSCDEGMARRARKASERLRADRGAERAVQELEGFWRDSVATGRLSGFVEGRRARPRRRPPLGCLAWCCR